MRKAPFFSFFRAKDRFIALRLIRLYALYALYAWFCDFLPTGINKLLRNAYRSMLRRPRNPYSMRKPPFFSLFPAKNRYISSQRYKSYKGYMPYVTEYVMWHRSGPERCHVIKKGPIFILHIIRYATEGRPAVPPNCANRSLPKKA